MKLQEILCKHPSCTLKDILREIILLDKLSIESFNYFMNSVHLLKKEVWNLLRLKPVREQSEIVVLAAVANNPYISCWQIECFSGITKTSVWIILKRYKYHPFHISLHQELHDFQNRVTFCEWLHEIQRNKYSFYDVLITDEATFIRIYRI